jgi:methanogenic corrinoid protein MtbC1
MLSHLSQALIVTRGFFGYEKQITEMVKPKLSQGAEKKHKDRFVLGTVAGDIHAIGLNIVDFMLDVNGFEIHNRGVDISPQKFIDKINETGAGIVGLRGSSLTLAFDSMKETADAIKAAGLRDKMKIMIGGGQIDETTRRHTGVDVYGKDAMAGVSRAKEWAGGK